MTKTEALIEIAKRMSNVSDIMDEYFPEGHISASAWCSRFHFNHVLTPEEELDQIAEELGETIVEAVMDTGDYVQKSFTHVVNGVKTEFYNIVRIGGDNGER